MRYSTVPAPTGHGQQMPQRNPVEMSTVFNSYRPVVIVDSPSDSLSISRQRDAFTRFSGDIQCVSTALIKQTVRYLWQALNTFPRLELIWFVSKVRCSKSLQSRFHSAVHRTIHTCQRFGVTDRHLLAPAGFKTRSFSVFHNKAQF